MLAIKTRLARVFSYKQVKLVVNVGVGIARQLRSAHGEERHEPSEVKYIMGHADIATAYNIYTHLGFEEVLRIEREGL